MSITVTVEDPESGKRETTVLENDYMVICEGQMYLAHQQVYPTKGTYVMTIKTKRGDDET